MSEYEPQPLASTNTTRERAKFPLHRIECGQMIVVEAHDIPSARTLVARYNKQHPGVNLRTKTVEAGRLQIYREIAPAAEQLPITQPSQFEFVAYLQSLDIGKQAIFNASYKLRFGQFREWINALEDATSLQYAIEITHDVMTVTRQPDYIEPVITNMS